MQVEYSPDSQIKECLKYAESHNIYIPPENIYRDDGISGKSASKRGDFMRMINDAKKTPRPFDVVLIYAFSRFARNKYESVVYKHMLRDELGIEVISITQPLPDTPDKVLLESLYEGMDEQYILRLAKESLRGKKEKASRGEHMGHAPYGYWYDKNSKTLIPDPETRSVVESIFYDFVQPDGSLNGIAKTLNRLGVKTARGNHWNPECIKYLLRNPVYRGQTRFCLGGYKTNHPTDCILRDGKHEPIIDVDIFEQAQQKLDDNDKIYLNRTKPVLRHDYWLRGLLRCSNCGRNLVMIDRKSGRKRKPFYQCNWYNKHLCSESHQVLTQTLDGAILAEIKRTFTEKLDIHIEASPERLDDVALLERSIERQNQKLERVKSAFENGIDNLQEYGEKKARLLAELEKLNNELEQARLDNGDEQREAVYNLCKTAYEALTDDDVAPDLKFKIAHELIDNIVFDKKNSVVFITYRG